MRPSPVSTSSAAIVSCTRPVPERRRLDADTGDRAAERDRLQLRDHGRHRAAAQRGVDQRLVGDHPFGLDDARRRDRRGSRRRTARDRSLGRRCGRAVAEQVRRRLGETRWRGRAAAPASPRASATSLRRLVVARTRVRRSILADTGTRGSSDSCSPTLPLLTVTWNRSSCGVVRRGTSPRTTTGRCARCGESARRSASDRARGSPPSCGRSARPRQSSVSA